jgi:hypothetical protein
MGGGEIFEEVNERFTVFAWSGERIDVAGVPVVRAKDVQIMRTADGETVRTPVPADAAQTIAPWMTNWRRKHGVRLVGMTRRRCSPT